MPCMRLKGMEGTFNSAVRVFQVVQGVPDSGREQVHRRAVPAHPGRAPPHLDDTQLDKPRRACPIVGTAGLQPARASIITMANRNGNPL